MPRFATLRRAMRHPFVTGATTCSLPMYNYVESTRHMGECLRRNGLADFACLQT